MHNASTGVTMEFKYNHSGIRTQKIKKVNGTVTETTDYTLKGKLIAAMKKNTTIVMDALRYAYGEEKFSAITKAITTPHVALATFETLFLTGAVDWIKDVVVYQEVPLF